MQRIVKILKAVAVVAIPLAVAVAVGAGANTPAVPDAFEYAFRFASAIDPDPKDKSMAQEGVVLTLAEAGGLGRATDLAEEVTGWRQGTVYADLAVFHVKADDRETARTLVVKAREVRDRTEGWQRGRIDAHIAHALALIGDDERSREIAARLARGDIQYAGRGVATVASGHAYRGDYDEAMRALATLDAETDYEVTWWRTLGYLEVAERERFSREQRRRALDAAVRSAGGIPGWKMGEGLQRVADALIDFGDESGARDALERAEGAIEGMSDATPVKGPLLADLARTRARLGETERGLALLDRARASIGGAIEIERPAIYAAIGAGYLAVGDRARAREYFDSALLRAEQLVNARPRALAVTAVCATFGRHGFPLDDAARGRLDRLYAGLRAPW